jgi:hypothetical protein
VYFLRSTASWWPAFSQEPTRHFLSIVLYAGADGEVMRSSEFVASTSDVGGDEVFRPTRQRYP